MVCKMLKGKNITFSKDEELVCVTENDACGVISSIRQSVTDFVGENTLNADIAIAVLEYTPQKNGK